MKVRFLEPVTLRSELIALGAELDLPDLDAQQLIAAGHAEAVTVPVDPAKPEKTQSPKE